MIREDTTEEWVRPTRPAHPVTHPARHRRRRRGSRTADVTGLLAVPPLVAAVGALVHELWTWAWVLGAAGAVLMVISAAAQRGEQTRYRRYRDTPQEGVSRRSRRSRGVFGVSR